MKRRAYRWRVAKRLVAVAIDRVSDVNVARGVAAEQASIVRVEEVPFRRREKRVVGQVDEHRDRFRDRQCLQDAHKVAQVQLEVLRVRVVSAGIPLQWVEEA